MKKSIYLNYRRLLFAGSLVAAALLISACTKNDDNNTTIPTAHLMAFNLASDKAAGIDIRLSGNSITNFPLTYTSYTGVYLNIYTGQRQVQTYDAATNMSMTSSTFTFNDSSYYSLFVVGANNTYSNIIVRDNFDSLSNAGGQAYIRYINAIPDSSQSTVTVAIGGSNIINMPAGYSYISGFTAATPGSAIITVSNGGTIQVNRTITLEQNKVYTVLLTGMPGGTGDQAVQIKYIENGTLAAGNSGT
jgi:hypothetical protein